MGAKLLPASTCWVRSEEPLKSRALFQGVVSVTAGVGTETSLRPVQSTSEMSMPCVLAGSGMCENRTLTVADVRP